MCRRIRPPIPLARLKQGGRARPLLQAFQLLFSGHQPTMGKRLDALSEFLGRPVRELPPDPVSWVLEQPVTVAGRHLATRVADGVEGLEDVAVIDWSGADPWNESGDEIVNKLRHSARRTALVRGRDDETAVQGRIDLAERLRLETGRTVIVQVPEAARAEAAAAVVCGRCDLVRFSPESA